MGTGKITDFSKPNQDAGREVGIKRLEHTNVKSKVEVLDGTHGGQPAPVEVHQHEELIIEGQNKIRAPKKEPGKATTRMRVAKDPEAWNKVKRGEDE